MIQFKMFTSIFLVGILGIGLNFASSATLQLKATSEARLGLGGWNELLRGEGIFSNSLNAIRVKSSDDSVVVAQFKNMLSQDEVLETAYLRYRVQFKTGSDSWNLDEFKNQLLKIVAHNLEANAGKHSWWMGVHQFTDMTITELKKMRGAEVDFSGNSSALAGPTRLEAKGVGAPAEVDHVSMLRVTSVKNQGDCVGADSVFAAVAVTESAFAVTKNWSHAFDLSVQQVMDCAVPNFSCEPEPDFMKVVKTTKKIFNYLYGKCVADWKSYPASVPPTPGTCRKDIKSQVCAGKPELKLQQGEEELKQIVAKSPAVVQIYVSDELRKNYGGGVYDGSECGSNSANHFVALVGYGTEGGKDYWLIKNSWGQVWGNQGFLKLARNGGNICGISTVAIAGSIR